MVRITTDLIKRKSEHNEGIMGDLEEISLHQLEIEKIEVIGDECRKIKILYFQNNIISKLENLTHLKDLEYLNLALNNIAKIEGLYQCEFLNKLDLTVNFVDLDSFEESINNLVVNKHLKELFLPGNPCADWEGYREFVITTLPQLKILDGKEITRSERIRSKQKFDSVLGRLRAIAPVRAAENARLKREREERGIFGENDDMCEHTPEVRSAMYRETAEEKAADELKKKEMLPRERNYEKEHVKTTEEIRSKEISASKIMQCNQGRWEFALREDEFNNIILEVDLSKHISTSLIDADVQPTYVSVIIKNKVFRLEWPEEVNPDIGTAERSKTTGNLVITVPKVKTGKILKSYKDIEQEKKELEKKAKLEAASKTKTSNKMGDLILAASVDFRHITKKKTGELLLKEVISNSEISETQDYVVEDDFIDNVDVPPLE